jgi:putative nucleotidyltransferase with HDIG domain
VSGAADPLAAARETLRDEPAWLVGGAVRDRLLGRPTTDFDVALAGDPRAAARRLARATRAASFALSDAFGSWRVAAPGGAWQVDLVPLRDGELGADLAARDFTINAIAEPLGGGEPVDPHGGAADLAARRLRMVAPDALSADPLRTLRAVRLAVELGLDIELATGAAVRAHAAELARVAPERVFAELKRVVAAPEVRRGLALLEAHGLTEVVLPELGALRGVEQNVFHHADVHDHTLEVLDAVVVLQRDPAAAGLGEHAGAVGALLAEPLAEGLTRGDGMRFAALLHDAAKPQTRGMRPDGRVTFIGHDTEGAELARAVLRRLRASERLVAYVAALTQHHLRLGFLVHERPVSRRSVWRYLQETAPYEADVTVFTVADRLATRGRNAEPAIAAHLELAQELLADALARREGPPPEPLVRGDQLAAALGIAPGPELGRLLAALEEDRFAGDIATPEDAVRRARERLAGGG